MQDNRKNKEARRERRRERVRNDLAQYGSEILNSEEMKRSFGQTHHTLSTVGQHTMRVAEKSLAICYALRRLRIPTDIPAVVSASLCHDLGLLGRYEKYASDKECGRQHPADSVALAQRLVSELPEKTADIIARHMWPFGKSKPPNSLEAAIVSTADKIAAVEDFMKGYEENRPGIRGVVRVIKNRRKEQEAWKAKKR